MKQTYYDLLQVSSKAAPEIITAAYEKLRDKLTRAQEAGDQDARNQLIFLNEAYGILSSPQRRASYDESLDTTSPPPQASRPPVDIVYQEESAAMSWWRDSRTAKLMVFAGFLAALFSAYKFMGQRADQKIKEKQVEVQAVKAEGELSNDAYRAESERMRMENREKQLDRSYELATVEAERRRAASQAQADARAQRLEMERERLEMARQRQQWAQDQYERDRSRREAEQVHQRNKRQLCDIYRSNGQYAMARAEGC